MDEELSLDRIVDKVLDITPKVFRNKEIVDIMDYLKQARASIAPDALPYGMEDEAIAEAVLYIESIGLIERRKTLYMALVKGYF